MIVSDNVSKLRMELSKGESDRKIFESWRVQVVAKNVQFDRNSVKYRNLQKIKIQMGGFPALRLCKTNQGQVLFITQSQCVLAPPAAARGLSEVASIEPSVAQGAKCSSHWTTHVFVNDRPS